MSVTNRSKDRDARGRLKRCYRGPHQMMSTPGYWVRLYMNRPLRHVNHTLCDKVLRGADPECVVWPLGSRKPHVYFC